MYGHKVLRLNVMKMCFTSKDLCYIVNNRYIYNINKRMEVCVHNISKDRLCSEMKFILISWIY